MLQSADVIIMLMCHISKILLLHVGNTEKLCFLNYNVIIVKSLFCISIHISVYFLNFLQF